MYVPVRVAPSAHRPRSRPYLHVCTRPRSRLPIPRLAVRSSKAIATLLQAGKILESEDGSNLPSPKTADSAALTASITVCTGRLAQSLPPTCNPVHGPRSTGLACATLRSPAWEGALIPYLELATASPEPISIAREPLLRSANEANSDNNGNEA
ncbi:hypothetical protein FRC08_003131 [Ceratobasidium sp. 394]|nr:hypothetical protein FRC08_003131 [Ceratobasidium sp. 394]KAG9077397.1 hypothetical protein FS749_010730 [Ceratobasidium sp. UAMH 11750]